MRACSLQREHTPDQLVITDLDSLPTVTDPVILTEYTAEIATREKYSSGSARTADAGFLPHMQRSARNAKRIALPTVSSAILPIHATIARASITLAHLIPPFAHFLHYTKKILVCQGLHTHDFMV
jgi:hypothetical protein